MNKALYSFLLRNDLLIGILFFIIYIVYAPALFSDPDVAWHIKAGDLIIKTLSIPLYDTWSYIPTTQKWYNISWIWDLFISLLNTKLGLPKLQLINCFLHASLLVCLYHALKLWTTNAKDTKFVTTCLSGIVLWDFLYFRPQALACYFVLALIVLLKLYRDNLKHKYLLCMPFLFMLWANIHGSFILGLGIIFVYLLYYLYTKDHLRSKYIFLAFTASLLATLINPYGIEVYYAILRTLHSEMYKHIAEWSQFTYSSFYGASLIISIFLLLDLLAKPTSNIHHLDKIIAYTSIFASLCSIRYFAMLSILAAPYLACRIKDYVEKQKGKRHNFLKISQATMVCLAIIFSIYLITHPSQKIINDPSYIPYEEIEYIKQNYPGHKIFNNYNTGGYIIYYSDGSFKHFIDGRAGTAFTEDALKDYLKFKTLAPNWEEIFDKYTTNGAIISHKELKNLEVYTFFKKWKEVFSGKYGKVFIKKVV